MILSSSRLSVVNDFQTTVLYSHIMTFCYFLLPNHWIIFEDKIIVRLNLQRYTCIFMVEFFTRQHFPRTLSILRYSDCSFNLFVYQKMLDNTCSNGGQKLTQIIGITSQESSSLAYSTGGTLLNPPILCLWQTNGDIYFSYFYIFTLFPQVNMDKAEISHENVYSLILRCDMKEMRILKASRNSQ